MQPSLWVALLGAAILISLTPGAGAINTMANSLTAGWFRSIWGILGQQVALVVHIVIVALGLGVLVTSTPWLFTAIRLSGAAYLVYLGVQQWRHPVLSPQALDSEVAWDAETPAHLRAGAMFRRGLLVNLTNPKAVVFFLAFLPQFIRLDRPLMPQYGIVTLTVVVVDTLTMWFVFAAGATGLRRIMRREGGERTIGRLFGALFIAVGVLLAVLD